MPLAQKLLSCEVKNGRKVRPKQNSVECVNVEGVYNVEVWDRVYSRWKPMGAQDTASNAFTQFL